MARRKRSSGVSVDFEGTETRKLAEEGKHKLKVKEVTQEKGDKGDYFAWIFEVVGSGKKDPSAGATIYYNTSLTKQSLWNLKGLLEALGQEVPDGEMDIDLDDYVDLEMMGEIEHETFNHKKQARLVDFWSVDDDGTEKDEDDDKGKKSSKSKEEEDAAGELPDPDDIDDMDEDDLKEVIDNHDLDVDPDDYPKLSKLKAAVKEAVAAAAKKAAKGGKKTGKGKKDEPEKVSKDAVEDMSQEELEDLVKEHDLEVDLDDFKTLRKMRAAVVDALEKEDLLDE